jgi:hypothetical protein
VEGAAGAAAAAAGEQGTLTDEPPPARFRLLSGEVRARTVSQGGRGAETVGTLERSARRYEGPFGPIEIALGEGLRVTKVWGPSVPTVVLPWGPAWAEDITARQALRAGVRCAVGAEEWLFSQPSFGLSRERRAIHVVSPRRRWVARLRSFATRSLEHAEGGAWVMRLSLARGGQAAPSADGEDALLAALIFGSNLIHHAELGYAPF